MIGPLFRPDIQELIRDKRFRTAVHDYLRREREAVADQIEWYDEKTSLKRDDGED